MEISVWVVGECVYTLIPIAVSPEVRGIDLGIIRAVVCVVEVTIGISIVTARIPHAVPDRITLVGVVYKVTVVVDIRNAVIVIIIVADITQTLNITIINKMNA